MTPEVTPPPFDISTLDTIGVFEPDPVKASEPVEVWPKAFRNMTTGEVVVFKSASDDLRRWDSGVCVYWVTPYSQVLESTEWMPCPLPTDPKSLEAELTQLRADYKTLTEVKDEAFAQARGLRAEVVKLRESLKLVIKNIGHETCQHESTIRGGNNWTICEDCGRRWADDRGGFVPYVEPKWLTDALSLVADPKPSVPEAVEVPHG